MTVLRTTRPETEDRRPARTTGRRKDIPLVLALGLGVALVGLSGCGSEVADGQTNPEPAPYRPCMTDLPPPTVDQVRFDTHSRRLSFSEQAGPTRWMVKRSDAQNAQPAGPEVTLPEGLNADSTFVYYTRPGGLTSRHLTLAQIQAARPEHASDIR